MNPVVALALRHRVLVLVLLALFLVGGGIAFRLLNIEAYPDPVPPMVEVVTQNPGQSAGEIERTVTMPIEIQLAGIKNVKKVETISLFGLSDVRVQFTFDYDYDQAKQQVINALSQVPPLPGGAQPGISPTSPIGEIYRYRIVGPKNYSVTDLKTIQDWILQRRFKAVPGVIDVNGWPARARPMRSRSISASWLPMACRWVRCSMPSTMPTAMSVARRSTWARNRPWCAAWA